MEDIVSRRDIQDLKCMVKVKRVILHPNGQSLTRKYVKNVWMNSKKISKMLQSEYLGRKNDVCKLKPVVITNFVMNLVSRSVSLNNISDKEKEYALIQKRKGLKNFVLKSNQHQGPVLLSELNITLSL